MKDNIKMVEIELEIDSDLLEAVRIIARAEGLSPEEVISRIITLWIRRETLQGAGMSL